MGKDAFAATHNGVIVIGTCVFWDNYPIELAENREFAIRLLTGDF